MYLRKAALVSIWLAAFLLPLAIIPGSIDSVAVKLAVFTGFSGLLLVLAGLRMFREGTLSLETAVIPAGLAVILALVHMYPGSNTGTERSLQLLSAASIVLSAGIFRIRGSEILKPLVAGGALALAVSVVFPGTGSRLSGTFGNPNLAGAFAAGLLPSGFFLVQRNGWKGRAVFVLLAALCVTVIIRSGTRASMIALPAGAAVVLLLIWKRKLLVPAAVLFTACAVLLILKSGSIPALEGSPGARQAIWQGTAEMIGNKPLTGWGTGSFQPVFPGFRPADFARRGLPSNTVHAHSEPAEILASNGIAGLLLWALFWILLFRKVLQPEFSGLERTAAAAGIAVILIESSVSVSISWTSSFFLLTLLAASVASQGPVLRISRLWAIPALTGGLILIFFGTGEAIRRTRASEALYQAVELQSRGEGAEDVVPLCIESIQFNGREPASWFIMGNQYGLEAERTADTELRRDFIDMQLAAYDSLEKRVPDYAWAVQNRASAYLKLGNWDMALDELMNVYRTRIHLKSYAIENGILILPLAGESKSLEFSGLLFSALLAGALVESAQADTAYVRNLQAALGTIYAEASVVSPECIPVMMHRSDSIFSSLSDPLKYQLMESIERETDVAPEGHALLQEYLNRGICETEEAVLETALMQGIYAPYHRALLCLISRDSGSGEYLEIAIEHAGLLSESLYPMAEIYPGGDFIFTAVPLISAAGDYQGHMNVLENSLESILKLEAFQQRVSVRVFNSIGGSGSFLIDPGQIESLLGVPGAENSRFRISAEFSRGVLAYSVPGADRDSIVSGLILFRRELESELGTAEAYELLTVTTAETAEEMAQGHYGAPAAASAGILREAFLR